jgi:hypothetical protein
MILKQNTHSSFARRNEQSRVRNRTASALARFPRMQDKIGSG